MRIGKQLLETDLYAVLGVTSRATHAELRQAYRSKVRASHPDLNPLDPGASKRAAQLNVAARVLLDPDSRRSYDSARAQPGAHARGGYWAAQRPSAAAGSVADEWTSARAVPKPSAVDNCWRTRWQRLQRLASGGFGQQFRTRAARKADWLRRHQIGVTGALVVLGFVLIWSAGPANLPGTPHPTTISAAALTP
ncbi:MAG TPA: J domain-containing protein [Polyangiaceae bacterium]|jgi:curved DNA-binding protein CbpA|nr:J domain-containing protein [Polyangiaceae bacterium]